MLRTSRAAAFILRMLHLVLAVAALGVAAGSALHGVAPLAASAHFAPVHATLARPEVPVAAAPMARDAQDAEDDDDGPPPEPQLEQIPMVPAAEPESLAT